jgi:hypothetical protein
VIWILEEVFYAANDSSPLSADIGYYVRLLGVRCNQHAAPRSFCKCHGHRFDGAVYPRFYRQHSGWHNTGSQGSRGAKQGTRGG